MGLFLRFAIDLETEMNRGTSLDFLAVTRDEAGLSEDATHDAYDQEIIEKEDGIWSVIPGLCGYALNAETIEEAIEEVKTMPLPYGDLTSDAWAIFEGEMVKTLPFGDGVAFRPIRVVYH